MNETQLGDEMEEAQSLSTSSEAPLWTKSSIGNSQQQQQ